MAKSFSPQRISWLRNVLLAQAALGLAVLITGAVLLFRETGSAQSALKAEFLPLIGVPAALLIGLGLFFARGVTAGGLSRGVLVADGFLCLILSLLLTTTWVAWLLPLVGLLLVILAIIPEGAAQS